MVGQIAGRPVRSRAVVDLTTAPWVQDWRVLALAGGGVTAATLAITGSLLHASSFLGVGYYLVRFALLFAAISLIHWAGPHRTIGWGVATATAAYFLTDAVGNLHSSATAAVWLQFLSVIVFTGLLVIRGWPFAAVPRRLPIVPPTQRPLAYVTLAAAAALIFLFFVAVPFSPYRSGTIIDIVGALAALLAVAAAAAQSSPARRGGVAVFLTAAGGHTVSIASLWCRLDAGCWRLSGSLVTTRARSNGSRAASGPVPCGRMGVS